MQRTVLLRKLLPLFILAAAGLTSCRTGPDFFEQDYPAVVARKGNLLLSFNLSLDRKIFQGFISGFTSSDLSFVLDRSDRITVSTSAAGTDPEFAILAQGSYPRLLSNMAIGRESGWEKHREPMVWWENSAEGLNAAVPYRSIALLSSGSLVPELDKLKNGIPDVLPGYVTEGFQKDVLTVYSDTPGPGLYTMVNIPPDRQSVRELIFNVAPAGNGYDVSGRMLFTDENEARKFSTALKLGLLMKMRQTGRSAVMKIVHESRIEASGNQVTVDHINIGTDDMLQLLAPGKSRQDG